MNRLTHTIKQKLADEAFKKAHDYPPLEDIQEGRQYALTISPAVGHKSYLEARDQMVDILDNFAGCYNMYPELSTKDQRWHCHGTIIFNNSIEIMSFYVKICCIKEQCTFKLRLVDTDDFMDAIQWYLYCRKQKHLVKPYIQKVYNGKIKYKIKTLRHPINDNK